MAAPNEPEVEQDVERLYDALIDELSRRHPRLRLVDKAHSPLSRVIDHTLRVLTLGAQDRYCRDYVTTLGARIYLPERWASWPVADRYLVMRHEAVHLAQFARLTWVGTALLYILLPLPAGFAAGRAWLEWQAYRETLTATWQLRGEAAARDPALHEHIVARFTGPDYAWMWVRGATVRRAIARHLAALAARPPAALQVPA